MDVDPLGLKDPLDSRPETDTETLEHGWPRWDSLCGSEVETVALPMEQTFVETWKSPRVRRRRKPSDGESFCDWVKPVKKSRGNRLTRSFHQRDDSLEGETKVTKNRAKKTQENGLARVKTAKVSSGKKYDEESKDRKHRCPVCQKTFVTMGHLNAHVYSHSEKKWKCDGCGNKFSCERSLTRHRYTFPGEHWFPCQHCDMNFFRVENILKHMEIKHPEDSLEAKRTGQLVLHITEEEKKEGKSQRQSIYICTECHKLFYQSEEAQLHKETEHGNPTADVGGEEKRDGETNHLPKYHCEICSKGFLSLEGFEYHKKNQHMAKEDKKMKKDIYASESDGEDMKEKAPWGCNVCEESFSTKWSLQQHVKIHKSPSRNSETKSGSHQCCICPRSFASSDGLKYHLAIHTGERRYACSHCDKKFIKKTHLYEHLATHSQVKCFKCPRCPRTFCTHSAYRKHIKHFPGPHSFPCTKCGKLFTKESMLEKHICVDLVKVTMAPEVKALLTKEITQKFEAGTTAAAVGEESPQKAEDIPINSSHSCYKCFKVFSSLDQLQAHQLEHIGKQQYQCRFCPETFKRADDFAAHIRSHLGSSPYMCLKCNRKFISPLTLSMHAKKYPGEHSFSCSKCQRWFPTEKRLERHECILQNVERFACACGSTFKNWNEFQQHAGPKPYKCCSCDSKFLTLVALTRHIKKHTGVKPFSCETCGKSFRAKNNYLHHFKMHKESNEIQCEHCHFKTKSKKRMNFHLFRKHDIGSNSSSTLCPICGIIFPYMTHVKKHIETVHANEFVLEETKEEKKSLPMVLCTLCGKLLSNKYMLANHMKKIHDPNAPKNSQEYFCEVCKEKFRSKKRLERHAEVHEAPGLRTCKTCSKEFFFARDLRKHMKRHDTNKPFSCPKCGKNFKVSVSLKYHSSICGNGNVPPNPRSFMEENHKGMIGPTNGTPFYDPIEIAQLKNGCYPMIST